jgi:hypothetical protein
MRRRREEHDAAHRRRHERGKRAHERKLRDFSAPQRELLDDGGDDGQWLDLVDDSATHHVSVRKGAAGRPALL